ncbi:MAG: beta-galactosidase [Bryobacteraceae bacterium]
MGGKRALAAVLFTAAAWGQGFLTRQGRTVFPIGSYELPVADEELAAMSKAGFNLVRCRNRADLDRAARAGMLGWVSVPMQLGADGKLRALIDGVREHSALAVWEGPDEIVWNFTAFSGLHRSGIYKHPDEWWRQTPEALRYAEGEAARLMPKLREGAALIRRLDSRNLPLWINEAARSDLKFIRQYLGEIDITGCDIYPIHANSRKPAETAGSTDRYRAVGKGKPVWMVLQGFAWGELQGRDEPVAYPTFAETRLMAWAAIAHGARGILYWGMNASKPQPAFRESIYAMAAELAALQPFLTAPEMPGVRVKVIDGAEGRPVSAFCRSLGGEWLIALVNEAGTPCMGVEVSGLDALNGRGLELLYGSEIAAVREGELIVRLMPHEVKVFATGRGWEARRAGRDFGK